ncbi:2508_t:CDS:2, partial [Racocetra fulgida]
MGKLKSSCNVKRISQQERHVDWMLACSDPTPLAFFRFIFPSHRIKASEKYKKALDLAFKEVDSEELRNNKNLRRLGNMDAAKNSGISSYLPLNDEIDKFFMNKENNEKTRNGATSNDIDSINFVERIEESKPMPSTCQYPWVLRSGTNVGDKLASSKIFEVGLLTDNMDVKMVENFNNEVKLIESDFLDVVEYFFDEVEKITKKDEKDIINAIDRLTPEIIEANRKVELSDEEKSVISILRRAVVAYAENLERIDLPVSEADFDNAFPNMLAKRFLSRSVVLRARIGQKCDFRGNFEKERLRSGGLPEPHRKKIYEDKVDLSVAMRDILYTFFKENPKAPSSDLHSTFVFGIHSW